MATGTATAPPAPATSDPQVIARIAAKRDKWKAQAQGLTTERDALKAERDKLLKDNEELARKADSSASAKRVAELEGKIREGEHRKVFDRAAKARGVAEDSLDLLYQASGYKAEGDPDEAAIGALIDQQKAQPGVSRLFGVATPTPTPADTPPIKPGPGSGAGGREGTPPSAMFAHDDPRINDVKYIMNNYETVTKNAQERLARGEI